ncbi:MAG: DUF1028 domain-containing protein [Gaiellaceae bacterium MAG52_C11]|nr:DUF1028 domain-containing protein [Candidatus Gaiellasilicea maunaloa]
MTYSLVARDPETGELGVAVQSRSFGTGAVVPWATAGVGAVATQSFSLRSYGPLALERLRGGDSPANALASLTSQDELQDFRQVAVLDSTGATAVHTGAACISEVGSVAGDGFSAQGNMLRSAAVVPALAEAFSAAGGSLAERLLAGLEGAEAAGGDFRGREAGAIVVVAAEATATNAWDRAADVRVDNHADPLSELRRLLTHSQLLRRLRRAAPENVEELFAEALLVGVDEDVARWVAASGLLDDDPERAKALLAPLAAVDERWLTAFSTARDAAARTRA